MKLLLLTYEFPPLPGGIGRYCATLTRALTNQGHEVVVIIPREIEGADSAVANAQVECFSRRQGPARFFIDAYRLYQAIQGHQPEYVLATHGFSFAPIGVLSLTFRFPYALTIIGSDIQHHSSVKGITSVLRRLLFQRALDQAEKVICISQYSRDLLQSSFPVPSTKLYVVYIGLDERHLAEPNKERIEFLRQTGELRDRVVLLTVARLVPRKGHDQVLKALSQIVPTHPDTHYLIVGTGPDEGRLRGIVQDLDIESNVTFAGYVAEEALNDYYDLADIYVMPSKQEGEVVEGFGLVFIEAAARGLPTIGGRHGGVPEAIVDGETGYLVDPHNPSEIAERIVQLIENPGLRRKMGERGRKRVLEQFTAQKMARNTVRMLSK